MSTTERQLLAQLLEEMRAVRVLSTEAQARAHAGRATNSVLEVGTFTLDANGRWSRSYGVAVGSVVCINYGAAPVTVAAGPDQGGSPPTTGVGVTVVPATSFLVVPINHHALAIYGPAAASIGVQVFTGMAPYGVTL